jgi:hypothetical protein
MRNNSIVQWLRRARLTRYPETTIIMAILMMAYANAGMKLLSV